MGESITAFRKSTTGVSVWKTRTARHVESGQAERRAGTSSSPIGKFGDLPISIRLWLLIVLNSSLALLLAGTGSLVYQRYVQRRAAVQEVTAQAGVLAES